MAGSRGSLNYVAVLGLLLAGIILGVAAPTSSLLVVLQLASMSLALLVALDVSGLSRKPRRGIAVVAVAALIGAVLGQVLGSDAVSDWSESIIGIVLAVVAPYVIVRGITRSTVKVDVQTVAGVLSIYLLLGLAFAAVIGIIDAAGDGPVFVGIEQATTSDRLYFSFITLATVGFGDLVPGSNAVRAAAVGAAIIGQIYLVSIVAVVVSNLGRHRPESRSADDA